MLFLPLSCLLCHSGSPSCSLCIFPSPFFCILTGFVQLFLITLSIFFHPSLYLSFTHLFFPFCNTGHLLIFFPFCISHATIKFFFCPWITNKIPKLRKNLILSIFTCPPKNVLKGERQRDKCLSFY